jgi:hypothetical protein
MAPRLPGPRVSLHWPSSSTPLPLVGAQFGDQRDHSGGDARTSRSASFPCLAHQQPAGGAGQIGHVRAPLIEDQVEAGAEAIPPLLQRLDAAVAAADLRGRSCRRKGRLGDAMPTCQRQFSERRVTGVIQEIRRFQDSGFPMTLGMVASAGRRSSRAAVRESSQLRSCWEIRSRSDQ